MLSLGPLLTSALAWVGRLLEKFLALLAAYRTGRRAEHQRQELDAERRAKEAYQWKAERPVDVGGDPRADFKLRDPGARRDPGLPPDNPGTPGT